ncbi:hypothetical protein [Neisseria yangbaofengii]|uniref:hypothetical protein n=1 Tax=Neisseria yangbaofengii TaxID=2709396 RepID=UPI0013EB4EB0|nr:hypothetical protein [Neisseria yangbaofengii]
MNGRSENLLKDTILEVAKMFDLITVIMITMPIGLGVFILIQSIKKENAVEILLSLILIAISSGTLLIVKHLSDIYIEIEAQNIKLDLLKKEKDWKKDF